MRIKTLILCFTLIFLSGCHYVTSIPQEEPSLSPAPTPSQSTSVAPTPTTTQSPSPFLMKRTIALYYTGQTQEGLKLFREFRSIPSTSDTALYALRFLVSKYQKPLDPDYQNLWGNGSTIHSISYSGNHATVDLAVSPLNIGSEAEQRAIDQLVWTLTANHPTTKYVHFTSNGKPFQSFAGFVDATQTFSRQLHYEVLAAVWVDQTRAVMSNPVTITGSACTFEAGVHWVLIRNGDIVKEDHTMAAGACPVRGGWSVRLGNLRAGNYVFIAQDISAKNGEVVQEDSKEFTIK